MKGSIRALVLVALFVCSTTLAGCTDGTMAGSSEDTTTEAQKALPEWELGDQWLYTFITPQFGEDSARLVVAEIDEGEGLYQLGISSEREAQRHAVINHNPFL
jgi:predicted small secreted protein